MARPPRALQKTGRTTHYLSFGPAWDPVSEAMTGLYLHTPFCQQKCIYCDFFSAPPRGDQLANWHLLLQKNLELIAHSRTPVLDTIFFGGGTPSLLSPAQIDAILGCCRSHFDLTPAAELSLEANPATLDAEKLRGYRTAGINRLSIGIQSFDDRILRFLGRRHDATGARRDIVEARAAGFDNISLDLIFALPGQTPDELDSQLDQLLELQPDHVGIYGLSIEEGTPLAQQIARGEVSTVTDETYAALYLRLAQRLTGAGFEHYEVSNFARPGKRCRHNLGYWRRQPCLAVGSGAHGFDAQGFGRRYSVCADLDRYREQLEAGVCPEETLEVFDRQQAMAETLYLGLRTSDGVDCDTFRQHFGVPPEAAFPDAFRRLESRLQRHGNRWFFPRENWLLYDHLISAFL